MMDKDVRDVFNVLCAQDKPLVWLATRDQDFPHLVPVCFVRPLDEKRLLIGNVFIKKTEQNLLKNPKVAVATAFKRNGWEGYLLKGRANILRTGTVFEEFKKQIVELSRGKRIISSALEIEVDEVYSLKPGEGRKRIA